MQPELDSENSAKNKSTLLRQAAPIGFQKMHFFEKGWQIACITDVCNECYDIMSIQTTKDPRTAEFSAAKFVYVNILSQNS